MKPNVFLNSFMCLSCYAAGAVIELPLSDWGENILNPPVNNPPLGQQVLHFGSTDYPYEACPEGVEFAQKHLQLAKKLTSDADVIRYALDRVSLDGAYLELGVCTGKSINFIAALNPSKIIYGFDSFEGNPEDWAKEHGVVCKGSFGLKDSTKLPLVLSNVRLIQGFFDESLPYFVNRHLQDRPIAFLHVDCDLYSSTNTALQVLGPYIKPGTIIVFDELYNYPEYADGEFKALQEFLAFSGYSAEYLAFNTMFENVAIRIAQAIPMTSE